MNKERNTSPRIDGRARYLSLDGLRGASTIGVVILHYAYWNLKVVALNLLADSILTLFFVLSSFLITSILFGILEKKAGFRNYYIRRGLRIYPAYYVFLLVFIGIIPWFLHNKTVLSTSYYQENLGWFLSFTQNFMVLRQPLEMLTENISLLHSWSLAVEEQFYLVWPLVLYLIPSKGRIPLFAGLVFLSIGARFVYKELWELPGYQVHAQLLSRVDAFGLGALLALALREGKNSGAYALAVRSKSFFVIMMVIVSVMLFAALSGWVSPSIYFGTLVSLFCVRIIYWCVGTNNWFSGIMQNKYLVFVGKISYGWYLVHFPIMWIVMEYMKVSEKGLGNLLLGFVVYAVISFVAAILLWQWVEKPFFKLKSKFTYH
ncbi:acyltransferase family protein [bacterium]|nr:acyltransferase family protein [bacterium]